MNTRNSSALLAGILTLLSGCAVGPNYHPPQTAAPANWSEPLLGGTTNSNAQVVEWWKTFNDPELDSLIQRAVKANYDLRLALGRLHESRATRAGAVADFGPTIGTSVGYTRERLSKNNQQFSFPGQKLDYDNFDTHFDATWEIDIFGGKRRTLEADTANLAASREDLRDVLMTVLGDVARNYMEVRGNQQRLVIARNNIKAQTESIELTQARFKAGLTSELDVKQAQALLATTEATVPTFETAMKQAIHALGVLLGEEPGALVAELYRDEPIPTTPPTVPVGLPSELLRRRPDVRRAERQLAAATAGIGVQTAELFPKLSLGGTAGLQSLSASDWFTGGSKYWSAGPTVTWRILDFARIRAQIKIATAQQEQAVATYEKTVLTSFQDVENALVAYTNEQTRWKALNDSVVANRRALEISNELYTTGNGDFLNVLDSERSLFGAEDQLVDSQRLVSENLVTLYKALGGGWETFQLAKNETQKKAM
ncbi:MAG TPA: efflux transporter outer membrane subunit [Verrucomicrobiae bacterium]|nr:efflux transporter outer membrane subunit [Verrucomicrobiae bacterium]